MILYKTCSRCNENKPTTEFYKDRQKRDGLRYDCKECNKECRRLYRAEHTEQERKWHIAYNKTPRGREVQNKSFKKWYRKNRDKRLASMKDYRRRKAMR